MASAIAEALAAVRTRIARAAERAGRDPDAVTLVAVSKKKPPEAIAAAYAAGQRDFGENYVQELVDKAAALAHLEGIRWHFIGHLQRNKVNALADRAHLIHGIDSPRLASAVAKRLPAQAALIQVSLAGEEQKSGCSPEALPALIEAAAGLALNGLMTMPPASGDPRPLFRQLRELAARHGLDQLSMGMSQDYEIAVEEGATLVRVGSAIFGERP